MENLHVNMHVFVHSCLCLNLHETTKRARFHVFFPFSASFYPPPPPPHYIIMVKGLFRVSSETVLVVVVLALKKKHSIAPISR